MARGYPDYQNPVNQIAGRLVDFSGIQTAILGLATLDGLGRLVWFDRFHEGVSAWELANAGAASLPDIYAAVSEIPPSCLRLRNAGAGAGDYSLIRRSFQFVNPLIWGLEWSVLRNSGNNWVAVQVTTVQSGFLRYMSVWYYPAARLIQLSHAGGQTTFVTLSATTMAGFWIPFKLVLDNVNGIGQRLVVGNQVFSITDYHQLTVATAVSDQLYVLLISRSQGAGSLDQYIGHVYLTLDEP